MADNPWLDGIRVGAQIAENRFQQSARTQQLKLQQAQRQMQERTLAAQAQMYLEHANFYAAQKDELESENNLKKAAGDRFSMLTSMGMPEEQAFEDSVGPLMLINPTLYTKMQAAKAATSRAQTAAVKATADIDIANQKIGLMKEKEELRDVQFQEKETRLTKTAEDANKGRQEAETGRNERSKAAIEATKERDLLKASARTDPKTGRVISKGEFVNRHIGTFIRELGITDEKEAARRLGELYDDGALGAPGSSPGSKAKKAAEGGYKVGTTYRGLRYLGGDPNDQSNWEQAK